MGVAGVVADSESFREMMTLALLFFATCFLAYSNGANDNFKGVAAVFGSRTSSYPTAISWAGVTTSAGSIMSVFLAQTLLKRFSGKGIVPDQFVGSEYFLLAVAVGAGLTVILATLTGFPISTTHALTAAIIGCGLVWQQIMDAADVLSAGTVSFARGLNDTPKIVALLLLWKALDIRWGFAAIAIAMAIGGLLNARKVAETMSKKITAMNHGQGFTSKLTTAILVVLLRRCVLPV